MTQKTPLYDTHLALHAKMVDFAGWLMPLHYGSQLAEHQCVREAAGIFDVSHMAAVDLEGDDAVSYLRLLLANNVDKLSSGTALYSCMLNEQGGIIDDLIVYKLRDDFYRLIVNAGTSDKDIAWMKAHLSPFSLVLTKRTDVAMLATQGPKAFEKIIAIFPAYAEKIAALKRFQAIQLDSCFIARTGYTGEEGYEWIVPAHNAASLWQQFLAHGFSPCGLGARDTLRLEAGFNLYGQDMDETVTPLESNVAWTVAWEPMERNFIGRSVLERQQKEGVQYKLVGLLVEGQGIPRAHQKVRVEGIGEGEVTSGSFSPTLKKGIALARVPMRTLDQCLIDIRGKWVPACVVKPPFVKKK